MAESEDASVPLIELETMIGFNGSVMSGLRCHPDRHHLVYAVGFVVVIENIETKKQDFLIGHSNNVTCLDISCTGKFVASGQTTYPGFKADVIIWDYELRELYARLTLHRNNVEFLIFSYDDRYLITLGGQDDGNVVVWNVAAKDAICGSPAQRDSAGTTYCLATSQNDNTLFVTAGRQTFRVWHLNAEERKVVPTDITIRKQVRVIRCLAIDANDEFAYCGTTTGDFLLFNLKTCSYVGFAPSGKARFGCGVSAVKILPNGEFLVGCGDGMVAIMTPQLKRTTREKVVEGMITSIAIRGATDCQFFIGTAMSNIYRFENLPEFTSTLIKTTHCNAIKDIAFPHQCSKIVATCSKQEIRIWYLADRDEVLRITVPNQTCMALAIMHDGRSIVSGWSDCCIRAYYPESGKPKFVINNTFGASVTDIATTSDCRRIISGSDIGHVVVWEVPEDRYTKDINYAFQHFLLKEHRAAITCIQMKSDNTECVTSSIDGSCIIWDIINKCRKHMLHDNTLFKSVAFHPREHQLITAGTDRKVAYWETFDGTLIRELEGSISQPINSLDIDVDGKYFVSAGDDKLVKLWDYESGEVLYVGTGHSAPINKIVLSPDLRRIVSVSADGAIFIWKFPQQLQENDEVTESL